MKKKKEVGHWRTSALLVERTLFLPHKDVLQLQRQAEPALTNPDV